jgi:hypothetical protein
MKLFEGAPRISGFNSFGKPKLPPRQIATAKFPVLTHGETPDIGINEWRFRVFGLVEREIVWTWDEFVKLPQTTINDDFHCVTTWSRFDDNWTGDVDEKPSGFRFLKGNADNPNLFNAESKFSSTSLVFCSKTFSNIFR